MGRANQFLDDKERLATLIEIHTGIPATKTIGFIKEYGVEQMLPCANMLCTTDLQRKKLTAVFEFKNIYETVKQGEQNKAYIIGSDKDSMDYFINYFADKKDREQFVAAYLSSQHKLLATKIVSIGTLDNASVYPREIIKEALFCNASSVIVAHNHPGGGISVSMEDRKVTDALAKALIPSGIKLLDHIIVAGDKAVSLASMGCINQQQIRSDIPNVASIFEKTSVYTPTRIKDQLAIAEKQLAVDTEKTSKQTNIKSRDNR